MPSGGLTRGDRLWTWIIRIGSFGVFIYASTIRGEEPSFTVAFLAICAAVLPIQDLRLLLRSRWEQATRRESET